MEQIYVKGFIVTHKGDESVGILGSEWKIEPDFYFENEKELKQFKKKLKEAWEYVVVDVVYIETYEERELQNKLFEKGIS